MSWSCRPRTPPSRLMRSTSILKVLASGSPRHEPGPLADVNPPMRIGSAARAERGSSDTAATSTAVATTADFIATCIVFSPRIAPESMALADVYSACCRSRSSSAEAHRDPAQGRDELRFLRAEDVVELAIMGNGMAPQRSQQSSARSGQVQGMHSPVSALAAPLDQPAAFEIVERRRQSRLVAAARAAERGLRQAGIVVDQGQNGKAPRLEIARPDALREGAERGFLGKPQMEADHVGKRPERDPVRQHLRIVTREPGRCATHSAALRLMQACGKSPDLAR